MTRATIITLLVALAAFARAQITVDESFDPSVRVELQVVSEEVLSIVRDLFDSAPPIDLPIRCYKTTSLPITRLDDWVEPKTLLVGINVTESQWAQFAFQLGHEVCHVMLNPRRTNATIETICMALGYEVLDRLSVTLAPGSPRIDQSLVGYSFRFRAYRELDERLVLDRLPTAVRLAVEHKDWPSVGKRLEQYWAELNPLLKGDIESQHGRDTQTLGAIAMRSKPVPWKLFWDLGACTDPSPERVPLFLSLPIKPECIEALSSTLCLAGIGCPAAAK